jgi:TonB-linked SusC/RagA family outer membrane protein
MEHDLLYFLSIITAAKTKKMRYLYLFCTLLFTFSSNALQAQTRQIRGKITSAADSSVLPGVTIAVKGKVIGTASGADGTFSLNIPPDARALLFSFIGMRTKEVEISTTDYYEVVMQADAMKLNEVVVTALGVSREKKSLGYAVSEVSGEDVVRSGEPNIIEGLAGKASGVQVIGSGGTPGASSRILLRGPQTIEGETQPLIVIDGIPVNNDTKDLFSGDPEGGVNNSNRALDINPEDIESVTILKGPAAAALYGSRAGAGVIMYTTKKGKYKTGLGVSYGSSVEMLQVSKLPEQQNKYAQGVLVNDTSRYVTSAQGPDGHSLGGTPNSWGPPISSLADKGVKTYDNTKNFFRTGYTFTNNLAITGGNEKTRVRLGLGNTRNDGIIPNTWLKRSNITLSAEHKLSSRLSLNGSMSYANTTTQLPQQGSNLAGVMLGLMRAPASFDLSNYQFSNGYNRTYNDIYDNPYFTINKNLHNTTVNRIIVNTGFNAELCSWLNLTYRLGIDNSSDYRRQIYAVSSLGNLNATGTGEVSYANGNSFQLYSDLLLTAKKNFGENLHSSLILGNNVWNRSFQSTLSRGVGLSVPGFYNLSNASQLLSANYEEYQRSYAFFFDGNIDYKSILFLGVTGRNEWASTFGSSNNNFFYPSVHASAIISEMLKLPVWFSFAKVRVAYAQSGTAAQIYSNKTYFTQPNYYDGFNPGNGFPYLGLNGMGAGTTIGNPNLKPERLTGQEYGADLRFFNGRLNLDLTYYYQLSKDVLLSLPISPSSGYLYEYDNAGELSNKGFEIQAGGQPVKTAHFTWTVNLTWSRNISKVIKLAEGVNAYPVPGGGLGAPEEFAVAGQPYGVLYGTKWQRTGDGKLIINPATGLPYVDPQTGVCGNPYPDWISGIRNTFSYKSWSFTFLWDIKKGGMMWNGTQSRMNHIGTSKASEDREHTFLISGVMASSVNAQGYAVASSQANTKQVSAFDYWNTYMGDGSNSTFENAIQDGGWVRLRDVAFSYHLLLKENKYYLKYLDFTLTGRNLLLFTKYTGVDPETSLTGAGSNTQGTDWFNSPGTRSYIFGIRAGF